MPNVHTPERQPAESMRDYRERRTESRRRSDAQTLCGAHSVHGGTSSRSHARKLAFESGRMSKRVRYYVGLMNHFNARNAAAAAAKKQAAIGR